MWFLNWRAQKNLVVNNEVNSVYVSELSAWSLPLGNLMFWKLAYLPSKLRVSGKCLFQEYQISAGQVSADSSLTETLYCLNRNLELII